MIYGGEGAKKSFRNLFKSKHTRDNMAEKQKDREDEEEEENHPAREESNDLDLDE